MTRFGKTPPAGLVRCPLEQCKVPVALRRREST